MKVKDILEGEVVYSDKFGKKKEMPDYSNRDYDMKVAQDMMKQSDSYGQDKNAIDKLTNDVDRKRYEKLLSNTDGQHVENYELIPYLRGFIKRENKGEFNDFINIVLTGKPHLYDIIVHINNMFRKNGTDNRLIGVSQNEVNWYFSKAI